MARRRTVLAIVGLPGSGKSLASVMLRKMGFDIIELGDIWRELLAKNGIPRSDPKATREFTRRIREKYGKEVYAKHAFRKIKSLRGDVAVLGIRSTYEMDYFRRRMKDIGVIALLAPIDVRFGRLRTRAKPEDPKVMKDLKWLDTREKRGFMKDKSEEKHGVMRVMEGADFVIANTSTVKKLEQNLKKAIKEIEMRNTKS